MSAVLRTLILPSTVTDFERAYLRKVNRVGLGFFLAHLPVLPLVAWWNDTGPLLALVLTVLVAIGPALAFVAAPNPRTVGVVYGVAAMAMGGVLVHHGHGEHQIEMHFYFFVVLAMMAVYANPLAIVAAAATVAIHHVVLFAWLPGSVFNHDATYWTVVLHALFVVIESVATVFIARSFFDNVVGLEKIVAQRTADLDARNRELRLVLDHVDQAMLTIDRDGAMSPECSATTEVWFGPRRVPTFADYLRPHAPGAADQFAVAWEQATQEILPIELAIDQLPHDLAIGDRAYQLAYTPIEHDAHISGALVVITDVTAEVAAAQLEAERREFATAVQHLAADRTGFLEFLAEAHAQVTAVTGRQRPNPVAFKRMVHTLKGNAAIYEFTSIAQACERIEDELASPGAASDTTLAALAARWGRLESALHSLLDRGNRHRMEVDEADYRAALDAIARGESHADLAAQLTRWRMEPIGRRLAKVREQARRIATRLGKTDLRVEVEGEDVQIDPERWAPLWGSFVHLIRNAIDHGIEASDERIARGKAPAGRLVIRATEDDHETRLELRDDGRGIDWQAVAARGRDLGVSAKSRESLVEALFADGLSTRIEVGEFSGRGVGLGAVRAATVAAGGTMTIDSEPGQGTTIRFSIPRAPRAPAAAPGRAA